MLSTLSNVFFPDSVSKRSPRLKANIALRMSNFSSPRLMFKDSFLEQRTMRCATHFHLVREVLLENRELVIGPAFTIVPQLFSLPLFIASILLVCQTIERNPIRYLLIISYFTAFIPQAISFLLYISPSSLYSQEWQMTHIHRRLARIKGIRWPNRTPPNTDSMITSARATTATHCR